MVFCRACAGQLEAEDGKDADNVNSLLPVQATCLGFLGFSPYFKIIRSFCVCTFARWSKLSFGVGPPSRLRGARSAE